MGTLAGWAYRKAITVNHTDDGAQTNYQMKLTVNHGDGADSTGLVYLNHHALNWPTDIQITASDGTTAVAFYRRESDATDGTWWLLCDSIPAGGTWTGYIYYGDADAADASSLVNTFGANCGDDFEWGAEDTDIDDAGHGNTTWTKNAPAGTAQISTDVAWQGTRSLRLSNAAAWFPRVAGTRTYAINWMIYKGATAYLDINHGDGADMINLYAGTDEVLKYIDSGVKSTGKSVTVDTWQELEVNDIDFTSATETFDFIFPAGAYSGNNLGMHWGNTDAANICRFSNSSVSYIDSVLVRKWTANEPTWAASGAEEALGSVIKSVPRIARIMLMSP